MVLSCVLLGAFVSVDIVHLKYYSFVVVMLNSAVLLGVDC